MHYDGKLHDKRSRLFLNQWSKENQQPAPQKKVPDGPTAAKVAKTIARETKEQLQADDLYCNVCDLSFTSQVKRNHARTTYVHCIVPVSDTRRAALHGPEPQEEGCRVGHAQVGVLQPEDGQVAEAAARRGGGAGGLQLRDSRRGKQSGHCGDRAAPTAAAAASHEPGRRVSATSASSGNRLLTVNVIYGTSSMQTRGSEGMPRVSTNLRAFLPNS